MPAALRCVRERHGGAGGLCLWGVDMNLCLHLDKHLARAGASNGVGMWCVGCGAWVTRALGLHGSWALPKTHPLLAGVDRDTLPRIHAVDVTCEICELPTRAPELHHWCPRALYRDNPPPNEGPQSYLCKPCHDTWHEIVTPLLRSGVAPDGVMRFLRSLYRRLGRTGWASFVRTVNDADARVRAHPDIPTTGHAA